MTQKINLIDFIPQQVLCGENQIAYPLNIKKTDPDYLLLSYITNGGKGSKREYSLILPKFINKNNEAFEVLGLLQAEMGKTNNGCLVFANHEYRLINNVMRWFEKELELIKDQWRWYIKININEPIDRDYRNKIESKVVNYWLSKTKIKKEMAHPKTVTYIKSIKNKRLKFYDYGTLIIEIKANLLSQIIKNYVKLMSKNILKFENLYIKNFMRGIIAGESCIELDKAYKKYRVHLSVSNPIEKDIYKSCLRKLNIQSKKYPGDKLVISRKENLIKLLKQRLMCLSPKKYDKFLYMMRQYPDIRKTGYFTGDRTPWNKSCNT